MGLYEREGFNRVVPTLETRFNDAVVITQKTLPGKTSWYVFETLQTPPTKFTVVTDTTKGQPHTGDDIAFRRMETQVERKPLLGKGAASPLRGRGTAGIAGIAGILYLVNLKRAVETFDLDDPEQIFNLGSAVAAVGSGINSGLLAFKGVSASAYSKLESALPITRALSGAFALRLFGYSGAFLSGITLGIHSGKQLHQGDIDAGLWYASASLIVTAGGVAGTYGGAALLAGTATALLTPVGWIALGLVLLVGSFIVQWTGESAKDDAIEKWLDACTFRKLRQDGNPIYATLDEELDALGYAMYAPKPVETDWSWQLSFNNYLAEAIVFLPGYNNQTSHLTITANGTTIQPFDYEHQAGGSIVSLREYVRKSEEIDHVVFKIRYRPSDDFDKDYTLTVTVRNESQYNDPAIPGP